MLLGVEDPPSEAVLRTLVGEHPERLHVSNAIGFRGWAFLKKRMTSFAQTSVHMPVIVMADLDDRTCAPAMVADWKASVTFPTPDLHLRIAVREVEAWLIADEAGMRGLLQQPHLLAPRDVDAVVDPKQWLLNATRKSPRAVREALTRDERGVLKPGVDYNLTVSAFARGPWDPRAAARRSDSLTRARSVLARLAAAPSGGSRGG